jgi:DNA primase
MSKYFTRRLLYRLRNEIPIASLLERLHWPQKRREGRFVFQCPLCEEFLTATNPRTNLGRCFGCERNFNVIDLVMLIEDCDFVTAVHYLEDEMSSGPSGTSV